MGSEEMTLKRLAETPELREEYLLMFSIRDRVARHFRAPYFARTTGVAVRMIRDAMAQDHPNGPSELSKHAEDFSLWRVGVFDEIRGIITGEEAPELVVELEALLEGRE